MKIIVGDENRAPRILLENIFRLKDYEILDAEDDEKVIELYKENPDASMVFASSTLPKNFDEFANRLKDENTGASPYLFLTLEDDTDVNMIESLKHEANDILFKPFIPEIVESKVELAKEEIKNGFNGEDFDPIEDLMHEHRLLERTIITYQVIASKMHDGVNKNILSWMKETALTVERKLHHRKEEHYMVAFLQNAIALKGEDPKDKLFNRASLKSIAEEHERIDNIFKRLQLEIELKLKGKSNVQSLKAAVSDYASVLKEHIQREERFLFPMSRKYIDDDVKRKLRVEFNKEEKRVGKEKLKKLEYRLLRIENILGVGNTS